MRSGLLVVLLACSVAATAGCDGGGDRSVQMVHRRERSAGSAVDEPPPRSVAYVLPLHRPVVDPFRAPATPWGAGNRGWEFDSLPGDVVVAVGSGTVRFAGRVAGRGVVTLVHADGLLSSVTGLRTVEVGPGERVDVGQRIGTADRGLHLGFRRNGVYLDPAAVYGRPRHAVLVPLPPGGR